MARKAKKKAATKTKKKKVVKKARKTATAAAKRKTKKVAKRKAAARKVKAKTKPKAAAKAKPRKAVKKTKRTAKKKEVYGEGNYTASRTFLKAEKDFVSRNRSKIAGLGKAAEQALDGAEGAELRQAETEAASHAHLPGSDV